MHIPFLFMSCVARMVNTWYWLKLTSKTIHNVCYDPRSWCQNLYTFSLVQNNLVYQHGDFGALEFGFRPSIHLLYKMLYILCNESKIFIF
jgi:hypothetical protein